MVDTIGGRSVVAVAADSLQQSTQATLVAAAAQDLTGSIRDVGNSPSKGVDADQDEEGDDVSQTLKASYNQAPASRNRGRTVSLDTAKAMMATLTDSRESMTTNRASVVGINNPRRQQYQTESKNSNSPAVVSTLGPLTALGGSSTGAGTDSKDDDSGWEIINHPPPLSGLSGQSFQQSTNPTPPHGRRRSGGGEFGSVLPGSSAGSKHGSPGNDIDAGSYGVHHRPTSYHKNNPSSFRDSSREDTALIEWCKRVSTMIVRVTEVADGILKKGVTYSRRQFLLNLTPEAIHVLRLEMLAQHMKDSDSGSFVSGRLQPASRRQSISTVKGQLNEFTSLVNVGFIYFHLIDYLRPSVAKTAGLKGGVSSSAMGSRHSKSSPTSNSVSPGSVGLGSQQSQSTVDRVLKVITVR